MEHPQNRYQQVILSCGKKVVEYIGDLDHELQIERDGYGEPYVINAFDATDGTVANRKTKRVRLVFLRDNKQVNTVLAPKAKSPVGKPVVVSRNWDETDGWKRQPPAPPEPEKPVEEPKRGERLKRPPEPAPMPAEPMLEDERFGRYVIAVEKIIDGDRN